ncbi:MAG: uroporphyrinogen-III C-methyltransferase [Alphaproteobacteria bacterium]|nr:uroporphyrinogen-III C-methyltransferase [Alphaproteobacteria bacterium]
MTDRTCTLRRPCVHLVGAGPGDPELLTVKAVRLLERADVVVYDRLVSPDVLDLVPAGTPLIYAGKAAADHHMPQEEINKLLVKLAGAGRRVVRLKGGDPYVFGRGSEETEYLAQHGVAFEVVPGITAAGGCAAAAGIPLTHRGLAKGVRFVTGHCRADVELDLNWESLADPETTLVFYMGLANLPQIRDRLIAAGLDPATPAAAIMSGTTPRQRVVVTTLTELPERVAEAGLRAPVLIVIGAVVQMAGLLGVDLDERPAAQTEARERADAG